MATRTEREALRLCQWFGTLDYRQPVQPSDSLSQGDVPKTGEKPVNELALDDSRAQRLGRHVGWAQIAEAAGRQTDGRKKDGLVEELGELLRLEHARWDHGVERAKVGGIAG